MSAYGLKRPVGDISTVLDLTDRDSQDNTYFPIDSDGSWFHHAANTVYPSTMSIQEFVPKGAVEFGQTLTFELGALNAGDLLSGVFLQVRLGSWYNNAIISQLSQGTITADPAALSQYWTYMNYLGTGLIHSAEIIVQDQTVERITGEFIHAWMEKNIDRNALFGVHTDGVGGISHTMLGPTTVMQTAFSPNLPFTVEDGNYFCALPFFFGRTTNAEVLPLLSCKDVRITVTLRPFSEVCRAYQGFRLSASDTPLGKSVTFLNVATGLPVIIQTPTQPPEFRDCRMVTVTHLVTGSIRNRYLRSPFEQKVRFVQNFSFEEPLKYLVSKPHNDTVEIQLPLELNHPVVELMWVFRRKAVRVNNEWANFSPAISLRSRPDKVYPSWLERATLRVNSSEIITADGDWFLQDRAHKGLSSEVYGYSFARYPAEHQPSGTANMSRATSVSLRLTVRQPMAVSLTGTQFDPTDVGGWEIFVYAMYDNWLRFENGVCQKLFID